MIPEYEKLTWAPDRPNGPQWTKVSARVMFRFYGHHTNAAAVTETEARLSALPGIDILDMVAEHPLMEPEPAEVRIVPLHSPPALIDPGTVEAEADARSRVACALDLLCTSAGDPAILDLLARALTRGDYQHWCAAHDWPGARP